MAVDLIGLPEDFGSQSLNRFVIKLLRINGKSIALNDILNFKRRSKNDYNKLRRTINYQFKSKNILLNTNRVKSAKGHEGIW